jgi:hypothetical protein
MRLEGLGKLKKSSGLIGNGTHNLEACSVMPQSTCFEMFQNVVAWKEQMLQNDVRFEVARIVS